jgi:hypothetical protein
MSDGSAAVVGDLIALKLQELQRHEDVASRPLVRIDARPEAGRAPFVFDPVAGRLHRAGCDAVPARSRTALYALWRVPEGDERLACPRCRPEPAADGPVDRDGAMDYLFGVLSTLDQFGSVIRQRGREFRESEQGRALGRNLDGLYASLDEREREVLGVVLASLDGLINTIADLDSGLSRQNGAAADGARSNGRPHDDGAGGGD